MTEDPTRNSRDFYRHRQNVEAGWRLEGVMQHFSVKKENRTLDTLSAYFRYVVEIDGKELVDHKWVLPSERCYTLDDIAEGTNPRIHNVPQHLLEQGREDILRERARLIDEKQVIFPCLKLVAA